MAARCLKSRIVAAPIVAVMLGAALAACSGSYAGGGSATVSPADAAPSAPPSDTTGGVHQFLPRLHNVTGIDALTAYCRDMYYSQSGATVRVQVTYRGPGDVSVGVFPAPGDGTNEQNAEAVVGSQESGHEFVVRDVIGKVDHVQVTVTANRGVDQCYARRQQ